MESKEIIEGNKLIAEFMGEVVHINPNGIYYVDYTTDDEYNDTLTLEEWAKYHTSWDWLIPVVEKIRKVSPIITRGWRVLDSIDNFDTILTFKHSVEFIKWYNENKNN